MKRFTVMALLVLAVFSAVVPAGYACGGGMTDGDGKKTESQSS